MLGAGHQACAGVVVRQSGEASRPQCAGRWGVGVGGGGGDPIRRGQTGYDVLGGAVRQSRQHELRRVVCQSGEAGQAVMCWGGGVPGRQSHQAGKVARQARPGRQGRQAGEAARQVRTSYAEGAGCQSPGRRGY